MSQDRLHPEVHSVRRQQAKSGKLSYGTPVVLRDNSKSRITFIPFFVPRTEGTDLAMKIETHSKTAGGVVLRPEKSVSLIESEARQLLSSLRDHLRVAEEGQSDGDYVLIRVSEGTAALGEHDPAMVAKALASVLAQEDIAKHLAETELTVEMVGAFRSAIRLSEMRSAVEELRNALGGGETAEQYYQDWCERHTWAFGNAYVVRDAVREISPGDSLDVLLPTVISGYRDLVELKRPDANVLFYDESHRNYYFASDMSKAIGQCHRYLDVLHEAAANGLRDHPEIVAYHPRATVVAGRSLDWEAEKLRALHGLNRRLHGISIMTYDQLLAQGERLLQMLTAAPADEPSEADLEVLDEDDFPF